jgi:RNA polymerase sigma-70 factor (ECF subfamily)
MAYSFPFGAQRMSDGVDAWKGRLTNARAGEAIALGEALEACRTYLLHVAEHELDAQLRAKGGASDIVQQTFMEAQQDFSRFSGTTEAELLAWLRRMLLNNISNFRRTYVQTAKRSSKKEVPLASGDSNAQERSWLADGMPTPSREMMVDEQEDALYAALDRLPEDYAQVLRLRYVEGLPFEQVAQKMNRSANAVRKLWARAIEKLQEEMGPPT